MTANLIVNQAALKIRKKRFEIAQNYVDRQCFEKMIPYVPVGLPYYRNSGKLRDSGKIPEPGKIVFTAPKARHDYYSTVNHCLGGNPNATRLWFETMKAKHGREILRGTAVIMRCEVR